MERVFRIAITSIILFFPFLFAQGRVISVKPNGKIRSLKLAFEKANDGDTVMVYGGVYKEGSLYLNKSITLIGDSYPEIDGELKYENLVVEKDGVKIKGFLFSNSGHSNFNDIAALKVKNSKNVLIEDCKFDNNFFGIHTMNSSYVSFIDNKLNSKSRNGKQSANGIHVWKANHITIRGNTINGHRDGIYLEFVDRSKILDNQSISNSRYGMHFMFSHDNLFEKNVFRENGAGVAVMYSKRVEMLNNVFTESWGNAAYGLLLKEIDDSQVVGNLFSNNTMGIYGDGANRVIIEKNEFLKNGWAIKMNASSVEASICGNNFIANTFDLTTNGNLKMKEMSRNYWDKYEGYDLNKDQIGDVPHRPISLYSMIVEKYPMAMLFFRSFMVTLMDRTERVLPSLTPEFLVDDKPLMKPLKL